MHLADVQLRAAAVFDEVERRPRRFESHGLKRPVDGDRHVKRSTTRAKNEPVSCVLRTVCVGDKECYEPVLADGVEQRA